MNIIILVNRMSDYYYLCNNNLITIMVEINKNNNGKIDRKLTH